LICVTGAERTRTELEGRLQRCSSADLQEIRLDLLDSPGAQIAALAASRHEISRLIVTCRPRRQGGGYSGDESERIDLLIAAIQAGVGFVDLEADVERADASRVLHEASKGITRVIRSHHRFTPGLDPRRAIEDLRGLGGHVLKLACQVDDAADLAPFLEIGRDRDRPVVLIGMGPAGILSRVCALRFGSAWTYVAADENSATAPGQLTWDQCRRWGLLQTWDPAPIVLLGGPQVLDSPGPDVYNSLFGSMAAPFVYLPVVTDRPDATLDLLRKLGLAGASVTMPLKQRVAQHLDGTDEAGRSIGAVNTIWRHEGGKLLGTNTDHVGVVRPIAAVHPLEGASVLVLGAGGTARAAVWGLARSAARVSVHNRTREHADRMVRDLGGAAVVADRIAAGSFEVLVNATSVGSLSPESPVPDPEALRGTTVLDCVMRPRRTRLIEQATSVGATTIDGIEMWLHQGAAQASLWLGRDIEVEALRSLLPTALGL